MPRLTYDPPSFTPSVAESLSQISDTLQRIHGTLQIISDVMERTTPEAQYDYAVKHLPAIMQKVKAAMREQAPRKQAAPVAGKLPPLDEPVPDNVVRRAKRVVRQAEFEVARDKFRRAAEARAKSARAARAKRPSKRQPSED